MAKKKDEGLLGPDGRALSQAFGGFGTQIRRYSDWRKAREARIQAQNKAKPKPTKPKPTKNIPASKRPADMRQGQVYGNDSQSHGRNWSKPHGQVSNKPSEGDRSTWAKPKPKPKPTNTKPTTTTNPTTTKPTPTKPARTPQKQGAGGMDANYKAWAKANPTLAKKVKKGQAGYKAINGTSTKTKPVSGTGNHRGAGNGAPGAQRSSLKTTPTKTKPTPVKPADKKPAKQKPLTVPTDKIPKNLTGAAGRKYLADLDAGKLTRKRK